MRAGENNTVKSRPPCRAGTLLPRLGGTAHAQGIPHAPLAPPVVIHRKRFGADKERRKKVAALFSSSASYASQRLLISGEKSLQPLLRPRLHCSFWQQGGRGERHDQGLTQPTPARTLAPHVCRVLKPMRCGRNGGAAGRQGKQRAKKWRVTPKMQEKSEAFSEDQSSHKVRSAPDLRRA